jgi:hypothetical protein
MFEDDELIELLGQLERHWPLIRHELSRSDAWEPFCRDLDGLLGSMEAPFDGRASRVALRRLLARHRIDGILGVATTHFRGGLESYTTRGGSSVASAVRSLRGLIGAVAWPPAVAPIVAFPEIRAPEEVRAQSTFRIEVMTRDTAPTAGSMPFQFERSSEGPLDLEVELSLPRGLVAAGSRQAVLRVPETGRSASIVFFVVASEIGDHEVRVDLRRSGRTLTTLSTVVRVMGEARRGSAPSEPKDAGQDDGGDRSKEPVQAAAAEAWSAPVETVQIAMLEAPRAPGAGLVLRVDPAGDSHGDRFFRVTLGGDSAAIHAPVSDILQLTADSQSLLGKLCKDLHDLMPFTGAHSREEHFRNRAVELGDRLLPGSIQLALRKAEPGTPLHIETDAWAPWEAICLRDPAGSFHLGERFAITRWLRQGSTRSTIPRGAATLVAPRTAKLDVTREREALQRVSTEGLHEIGRFREVQACLASGAPRRAFLHFACHGQASPDVPMSAQLALDDAVLHRSDVRKLTDWATDEPLVSSCVFVNACMGDVRERTLSGHGGWAEAFLAAGAAAVIAPAWSVENGVATRLAEAFYAALDAGSTVGESLRRARLAVGRPGEPDRLAFAAYAADWCRLATRPTSASA